MPGAAEHMILEKGDPMTRNSVSTLLPIGLLAGISLSCAHNPAARPMVQTQPPPRATPTTMVAARQESGDLAQMLAGRISGVSVVRAEGGGISILIRGPTSFYSSNEPLFVVDDVPVEAGPNGTLSWLSPQDIASISVLKDAQATIYGVRGANGVVVIRTIGAH